jgi:hypothetical protein
LHSSPCHIDVRCDINDDLIQNRSGSGALGQICEPQHVLAVGVGVLLAIHICHRVCLVALPDHLIELVHVVEAVVRFPTAAIDSEVAFRVETVTLDRASNCS